jgi:predicted O-methyltransferase YrrM
LEFSDDSNAPFDLIFIDGGHSYEVVKHDSFEAIRLINKQNGIILWHDATSFGVGKWLPELKKKGYPLYRIEGTNMALLWYMSGVPRIYAETC